MFVLDDRNLRDLANFIKGPIRQSDAAISDRQPTVRIIDDGNPLAAQFAFCREAVAKRVRRIVQQTPVPSEPWEQVYWPGKGFQPRQFRAPVLLFKSLQQPYFCVRDPEMGWGGRSTAGVEVVLVNAPHEEMLREPYAGIIGVRVADVLRRVNDRAAGDGATGRHSVVSVMGT